VSLSEPRGSLLGARTGRGLTGGWFPRRCGRAAGSQCQLVGEEVEGTGFEVGRHCGTRAVVLEATGGQRRMEVGGMRACLKRWMADDHDSLWGGAWLRLEAGNTG
jgi:hypothetical protein